MLYSKKQKEYCRYSASLGPRVIDWQASGYDPWDNPDARQACPAGFKHRWRTAACHWWSWCVNAGLHFL